MEFSNRDNLSAQRLLHSQSGQAVVEYILILVVTVGLILGGVYKLNDSFRIWANNYFGSYIPCLLETGMLPIIDGNDGDSSVCLQANKPFTPDGNPLLKNSSPGGGKGPNGGANERDSAGAGGSGTSTQHVGTFNTSHGSGGASSGSSAAKKSSKDAASYTGSTSTSGSGTGYHALNQRLDTGVKQRLDTSHYAFEDEKPAKEKRSVASSAKPQGSENKVARSRIRGKTAGLNAIAQSEDKPFSFGNFIRILIIAAILVALAVFLGGQMLQIGKSME